MKVLIFIALKFTEILAIVFIPWGLGIAAQHFSPDFFNEAAPVWIIGFTVLMVAFVVVLFAGFIIHINWEFAKEMNSKIKKT